MGCKGSKLEDQEAVALCRGRAELLAAAVRHRYALADAHGALADSLHSMAAPLHRLLLLQLQASSPQLTLPTARKGGRPRTAAAAATLSLPHGRSAHLDDLGSPSGSETASPADSPLRAFPEQQLPYPHYAYGYGTGPAFAYPPPPASSLQFYYARSRPPPPSVGVAQRAPVSTERVYYGSFDPTSGYPQYYANGGVPATAAPQRMAAPAPPRSPPRESSWAFLNVFANYEPYDNYYYDSTAAAASAAAYTPSRSSREVREEEGIPELEEDEDDCVFKEVASGGYSAGSGGHRSRRSSIGSLSSVAEQENAVIDNDVVASTSEIYRRPLAHRNVAMRALAQAAQRVAGNGGNVDVAGEIKAQLVRAAEATRELAPLLEVGKPSYQEHSHASSRLMSSIPVPNLGCKGVDLVDIRGGGVMVDSKSLSLTLEKLYFWERKLYGEVKFYAIMTCCRLVQKKFGPGCRQAEEKMRLLLAKNSKRLKLLDQRGAEAHKIDATRNLLRKLSTKIKIAVRVIAKVSTKINKVRDEELGPQVNALIQGFIKMWQYKLHSYHTQFQVISEAKNLVSVVSRENGPDLAMELELELIKWIINFSSWVNAHRNFVRALNGWLALCLNYETGETTYGEPPYSPGRIGAPLVFIICNRWSQAMDQISEKDVVNAMKALVSSVQHLWEQQNQEEGEERILAIRERERWMKMLEKKTLEVKREADELNKKLALVLRRQSLHQRPTMQTYEAHCVEASSVHINLRLVLQALENFAANSLQAFQEILRQSDS
ncbi:Os04g0562800 [Oryza sativa Japonica Group]|uniref:OSJNBb0078D11.3 protein n=1 Tax=Oryza sativa subsp. japonica TaxID=39947 RepID=Q7FAJ7_ORYSJ|nr:Os04g0562800 [Oryza sativa Japonica Group]CAD41419.2 OSJNBb0078D11.3 [Oryza sativa Japonica Group]|eukprot:NP_001053560.1 Os04g0562800 [Oryza sativa Japonica Group]